MDATTLIARLSHTDYSERRRAEEALVALGESAVLPLIDVVETQSFVPALRAASALSRLGDPRGVLAVARLLLNEVGSSRQDVILLLAQWNIAGGGDDPIAYELVALARKCTEAVSSQALAGLVSYGVSAIVSQEQLEGSLLQAIRKHSPGWSPPVQVAPTGSFRNLRDLSLLIQALRSPQHEQRNAATARLIELGTEAVPALIDALSIDSPLVRFRAAEALGKIGDSRAVEPLLKLSRGLSLDFDIQRIATEALQNLARKRMQTPEPDDVPALILLVRHLRFSQPDAADDAAVALTTLARRHPSPALRGALKWLRSFGFAITPTFNEAYTAIQEATRQWKDLPLTAAPPAKVDNLPLPATDEALLGQREGEKQQ